MKTPLNKLLVYLYECRQEGWSGDIREIINEVNYLLNEEKEMVITAITEIVNPDKAEEYFNEKYGE